MKRFHVHVAVEDLEKSIQFYSTMFGTDPAVVKPDYAKWMLEDPRINFAISNRHAETGVNHLGIQLDNDEELKGMHDQLQAADAALVTQQATTCCYAQSDKYWVTDPSGIAWETFHTLTEVPMFGENTDPRLVAQAACCTPAAESTRQSACCAPA